MKTVGVVIGRFQLAHLHRGHIAFIKHVAQTNDACCVLVGCAPQPDAKNLLPYPVIAQMIRNVFKSLHDAAKLHVFPLQDIPGEDLQWSMQIDRFLELAFPYHKIKLYSGRDSYKESYHGKFQPVESWYGYDGNVNGTMLRSNIMTGDPTDSYDFRAGIIYGLGNYLKGKE